MADWEVDTDQSPPATASSGPGWKLDEDQNPSKEDKGIIQSAKDIVAAIPSKMEQNLGPITTVADTVGSANYAAQQAIANMFRDQPQGDWSSNYKKALEYVKNQREAAVKASPVGAAIGDVATIAPLMAVNPAQGLTGVVGLGARLAQGAAQGAAAGALTNPEGRLAGAQSGAVWGAGGQAVGEAVSPLLNKAAAALEPASQSLIAKAGNPGFKERAKMTLEEIKTFFNPEAKDMSLNGMVQRNPDIFKAVDNPTAGLNPIDVAKNAKYNKTLAGKQIDSIIASSDSAPNSKEVLGDTYNNIINQLDGQLNDAESTGGVKDRLTKVINEAFKDMGNKEPSLQTLMDIKQNMYTNSIYTNGKSVNDPFAKEYKQVANTFKQAIENHVSSTLGEEAANQLAQVNQKYGDLKSIESIYSRAATKKIGVVNTAAELTAVGGAFLGGGPLAGLTTAGAAGVKHYLQTPAGQLKLANTLKSIAQSKGLENVNQLPSAVVAEAVNNLTP